jgi:hypothetical protein
MTTTIFRKKHIFNNQSIQKHSQKIYLTLHDQQKLATNITIKKSIYVKYVSFYLFVAFGDFRLEIYFFVLSKIFL